MNITKTIWEHWKKGEKGNQYIQKIILKKLKKLGIKAPDIFVSKNELKILNTLNSEYLKIGKSSSLINYDTKISYPTIITLLKRLEDEKLINSKLEKKGFCSPKRISKLTDLGGKTLQEWKNLFFNLT